MCNVYYRCIRESHCNYAAKTDVSTEILDMLRRKVLEMKDQLALVQQLGEIVTDIEPTSTQLTSMFPYPIGTLLRLKDHFYFSYRCSHGNSTPCTYQGGTSGRSSDIHSCLFYQYVYREGYMCHFMSTIIFYGGTV